MPASGLGVGRGSGRSPRAILMSFLTAGVGWAPFAIQVSAFSRSISTMEGWVCGL